jgi:hypothetical protein
VLLVFKALQVQQDLLVVLVEQAPQDQQALLVQQERLAQLVLRSHCLAQL